MPAAATQGSIITVTTGSCQTTTTVQSGNAQVLIGGKAAATVNSPVTPWQSGNPPGCVTTTGSVIIGDATVLVGGQPLAYQGSSTAAGPITGNCDATVLVG